VVRSTRQQDQGLLLASPQGANLNPAIVGRPAIGKDKGHTSRLIQTADLPADLFHLGAVQRAAQ
jgi:hypothetical protein